MGSLGPIFRISFGLVMLTSIILMGLDLMGWVPSVESRDVELRIHIAETVAGQAVAGLELGDLRSVRAALRVAVERNEEVLSAGDYILTSDIPGLRPRLEVAVHDGLRDVVWKSVSRR